ncbi:hypothetical protein BGW38_008218 [Lunasporangiospora selenospora]|uniref:O-methyltransferase n=1 Tax=Lunasporangiospora selenospora TaxID=979761 RepID=A0A9P6G4P3_9FUNG|nr:hypothetical protein BGW38_008218 [Lunasporangiospora selenospora]
MVFFTHLSRSSFTRASTCSALQRLTPATSRGFLPSKAAVSVLSFHTSGSTPSIKSAVLKDDNHPILAYAESLSTPLPGKFVRLREATVAAYPEGTHLSVPDMQGKTMQLLMRMIRPHKVLELGCFMGYSAMAMADGLEPGATLYTCEKDPKAARLSRETFEREGYTSGDKYAKIELLEGDAASSLQVLIKRDIQFDVIFLEMAEARLTHPPTLIRQLLVDADKGGYINYYNTILESNLLSKDGFIFADNTLFYGTVLNAPTARASQDAAASKSKSVAEGSSSNDRRIPQNLGDKLDTFNRHVKNDSRVEVVLLPIFDGLSVITRRR